MLKNLKVRKLFVLAKHIEDESGARLYPTTFIKCFIAHIQQTMGISFIQALKTDKKGLLQDTIGALL